MEDPPKEEGKIQEFVPPPLPLSFRFEYTLTSLSDILDALISTLEKEHKIMEEKGTRILETVQVPSRQPDEFLTHIDEYLDKLYLELLRRASFTGKPVSFSELTSMKNHIEKVRIFILLIFLAHGGRVSIVTAGDDLLVEPLKEVDSLG
ncbi:MAG: hypothetical protein ACP5QI_05135, partial [Candidatus Bathyarchaeia archaeon]